MMTVESVSMGGPAQLRAVLEQAVSLLWADQSTFRINPDPREFVLRSWDAIDSHLSNVDLGSAVTRFREEGSERLFSAHAARLGDVPASVTIDAVAIPRWYGTEPVTTSYPSVLRIVVESRDYSSSDRDRAFDWAYKYLSQVAQLHDAVSGRVTVGSSRRTRWERQRKGPVRPLDMYYWVADSRVLSPDWCLLLSEQQIEKIGGLAMLGDVVFSVEEAHTQSSRMFVIRVTDQLSDLADDPDKHREWIRILEPILW